MKKLDLQREFSASPERLFNAIKEGILFESCGFSRDSMQLDFRVGGKFSIQYKKDPSVYGEFMEIVANQKVVFTWSEMNTKVTILIEPKGESSILKLTHELVPDAQWMDRFSGGWNYGFDHLAKSGVLA